LLVGYGCNNIFDIVPKILLWIVCISMHSSNGSVAIAMKLKATEIFACPLYFTFFRNLP
jgi:hypothetical protein